MATSKGISITLYTNYSDLKVRFIQIPHPQFKRYHNDLVYYHKITWLDSLKCTPIAFQTIDKEPLSLAADEIIHPLTVKILPGKGMPILNDDPLGPIKKSYERGSLFVRFDIEIPKYLSQEQKEEITKILDEEVEWNK